MLNFMKVLNSYVKSLRKWKQYLNCETKLLYSMYYWSKCNLKKKRKEKKNGGNWKVLQEIIYKI